MRKQKRNLRKTMKTGDMDELKTAITEAEESGHPELYDLMEKARKLMSEMEEKGKTSIKKRNTYV